MTLKCCDNEVILSLGEMYNEQKSIVPFCMMVAAFYELMSLFPHKQQQHEAMQTKPAIFEIVLFQKMGMISKL